MNGVFFKLTKVDEAKREVWGRATEEVVDRSNEIFDYQSSKPLFQKWSAGFAEATDGKSLGNIRSMHGNVAAGKVIQMDFDDAAKAIDIGTKIVDDNEWEKVLEGVHTGFSIGGKYIKKWKDDALKATRYTADPNEISLVDSPCLQTAKFFDVVKADGSVIQKAFAKADDSEGPFADPKNKKYPIDTEEHIRAAWSYINKEKDADEYDAKELKAVKDKIIAAWKKVIDKDGPPSAAEKLNKGMWSVSMFAEMLQGVANMAASAEDEAAWEGDDSKVPAQLQTWLTLGIQVFREMAEEETAELLASLKPPAAMPEPAVLEMADKPGDLGKAGARHSAKDKDHLQAIHDHAVGMGADCPGAEKAEPTGDLAKLDAEKAEALAKVDGLEKALAASKAETETLAKQVAELKAQPVPPKGATADLPGVAINKGQDAGADDQRESAMKKAAESGDPMEMMKFVLKHGAKAIA